MPVEVWTARISTRDLDAFNVTRKSGESVFAPSWPLLRSVLDIRAEGRVPTEPEWKTYAKAYLSEMQVSHREHPRAWEALLVRQRVVLSCYCSDPQRCHRRLLGLILERLGGVYKGELPDPDAAQRDLFKLAMELDD